MLRTFKATMTRWLRPAPIPYPRPLPPRPVRLDIGEAIGLINRERASRGLDRLVEITLLTASAQDWADVSSQLDRLDHGNFTGRMSTTLPETDCEILPVANLVALWMGNASHRANLLGPWNVIGVGLARSRTGTPYWCADFDKALTKRPT